MTHWANNMNYEEALKFIENKKSLGIKPGLSRIKDVLSQFGNVQNRLKVIHVAGTNGKGTVCYSVAETLQKAGARVGLFVSPWVDDYREQIQINGKHIPKDVFASYVTEMQLFDLTEFELVTAVMYRYFYDCQVDYAVVECGMGGRGDATNVIDKPLVAVITAVSLDHTAFLGDTVEKIAYEKSGIIKKGCTTVLYPDIAAYDVFQRRCRFQHSKIVMPKQSGNYLENDYSVAQCVVEAIGFDQKVCSVSPPARCEMIADEVMLDGSHNPDGATALDFRLPKDRQITAVIAMMKDKDAEDYLSVVAARCDRIIATTLKDNPRAMSAGKLADIAGHYCTDVQVVEDPHEAVKKGMKTRKNDFLLICGSFYLAREIRKDF